MTASSAMPADQRHNVASGLHWVRSELDQNLQLASQLVEQHAETRQDPAALNKAQAHLHEVRGAAVLIQAYGVALLAEEMKQTVQDLAAGRVHDPDPAYAAVVSACVQAGDYLDLLQNGQDDSALVLQPIVNELRLARGKSLLTEDDLFVAQFRVLGLQLEADRKLRGEGNSQADATRLSPVFSAALLGWFKDQDSAQCLSRIGRVCEMLAEVSRERALHQLWRTAAACVEALLSRTLDETLELKRQFGRAGQLMKILAESGETAAVRQMSDVSLRLLFYAGRSRGTGPRVMALRNGLQLDTWLPPIETVQARRARLHGANTGLLVRVAEELRSDLAEVRDSIDMALRSGASEQEFEATAQRLKRVADTLLVLGLSTESQALAQPLETLREAGAPKPAAPAAWMEFATAVLEVDLSLESALYRQLQAPPGAASKLGATGTVSADVRDGTAALLRESLVNVARIKGYIEAYVKADDVLGLPEAARLLDEIAAGFRILDRVRAEDLVLDVQRFLQSPEFANVRMSNTAAGRFADAIAAIEYYIEFLRDGMPGAEAALDHLAGLVERMGVPVTASSAREPAVAADAVAVPVAVEKPFDLSLIEYVPPATVAAAAAAAAADAPDAVPVPAEKPEFHLLGEPTPTEPVPSSPAPDAAVASVSAAPPPRGEPEVDPEIREVFIAEAAEVLDTLQRALPRWLRQPEDRELMVSIRRSFHTLKGSGRMVGATDIGEFSWAQENLLNRALDRTVELSAALISTVREAVDLLPEMISAFRDGRAQPSRALPLSEQARQLAAGLATPGEATDLIAVFRNDAAGRLQMVTRWLDDQDRHVGEYLIPDPVVRAFHTLRGAALAIGARAIGELSGSLENFLDTLNRAHLPLPDAGLALVEDSCAVLRDWITHLGEPAAQMVDPRPWIDRVEAVRVGADAAAHTREADLQLANVFSFEALDLAQKFESELAGWSREPAAGGHARALAATAHALKAAADRAHCVPIAALAQALEQRLEAIGDAAVPAPAFFAALAGIVEHLYAQLDAYRDGKLDGDGADSVARVMALDPAPLAEPDVSSEAGPEPAPEAAPAPAEAINPSPPGAVESDVGMAVPAVEAAASEAPDPELLEIFLLEGQDLMEEIDRHAEAVAAQPDDAFTLRPWRRALHTLKGSARVTGMNDIGELAHQLESATELAFAGGPSTHARFRTQLEVAVDGLHQLLAEARSGRRGAFASILAAFQAAGMAPEPAGETALAGGAAEAKVSVEPFVDLGNTVIDVGGSEPSATAPDAPMPLAEATAAASAEALAVAAEAAPAAQVERAQTMPWEDAPVPAPGATVEPTSLLADGGAEAVPTALDDAGLAPPAAPPDAQAEVPVAPAAEFIAPIESFASASAELTLADAALPPMASTDVSVDATVAAESSPSPAEGAWGETTNELPAFATAVTAADDARGEALAGPVEAPADDAVAEGDSAQPAATADEIDPEVVAIFAPEAVELLDALQKALGAWREVPAQVEFAREMQRDLHTFKGGARMAGLLFLGESAHALETELVRLERLGGAMAPEALEQVGKLLDTLHHETEQALHGRLPGAADAAAQTAAVAPEPVLPAAQSWNADLFWSPERDDAIHAEGRREAVRVPVERLDAMLNQAGEISIYRSRLEENQANLISSLAEMSQTITRIREQLRLMDIETEAQVAARGFALGNGEEHRYESQFDPLEMDRYSRMQELSRALAESVSDLASLHASLDGAGSESEVLLQQQGRIVTEVQQGLTGTLMVPFSRQVQRLARVVRQTAEQNGKRARAEFNGVDSELDRNVLERMTAPLEHLLRNSVVHGIETPDLRRFAGKDVEGLVQVALKREGSQLLIEVSDDGRGLDFTAIRAQAVARGLMRADAQVADDDLARFVFAPGFSTAQTLTQDAGRGIGMDVVAAEVKQLGGTIDLASETGRGIRFRIRLPLTMAVSQALVVQVGEELFAIPLSSVEGIARAPRESLADMMREGGPPLEYGGEYYQVRRLGELVGLPAPARIDTRTVPAILMRIGDGIGGRERRVAVVAERLIGNREIVTKPAGPILGAVAGISGATILNDGRVMLIVDVPALIREATRRRLGDEAAATPMAIEELSRLIMVVDDSITIRRVTERLLARNGYRVITAKDGLDAMAALQTELPDAVLLDIEMPRADGFEVAAFIRNTPRISTLPIIMITSRSGDKHRENARKLGVDRYLIKPYQEDQLLSELRALLKAEEPQTA